MLIEEAREAQRNHEPVYFVGDLYYIEGFKKEAGSYSKLVAILSKVLNQRYAKGITIEPDYLMKLSESELKRFHEETEEKE